MKKLLLLCASALTAGSMLAAQPQVIENFYALCLSPNGEWLVGQDGSYSIYIKNLTTDKSWSYQEDESHIYNVGSGCVVSNTGVVVGSTNDTNAAVWENGEWKEIPVVKEGTITSLHGITPDASVICGSLGNDVFSTDSKSPMTVPALWYRQSDGSYGQPVVLPHPDVDFTGRIAQYVTAIDITPDGKTVIGQIVDYSGWMPQPILYTCDDSGKWTYTLVLPQLLNPNNLEFPEYPGEFEMDVQYTDFMTPEEIAAYEAAEQKYWEDSASLEYVEPEQFMTQEELEAYWAAQEEYYETWEGDAPQPQDYMTEEEWAAYQKAYEEYLEAYENLKYPQYTDFMTPAEIQEYEIAAEARDKALAEWEPKYEAFEQALNDCYENGFGYVMNNIRLSDDGAFAATTRTATVFDEMNWPPYKDVNYVVTFDLANDTYKDIDGTEDLTMSYVSEDHSVLARRASGLLPWRAYIIPAGTDEAQSLEDFVALTSPETATWMKNTMTHQVPIDIDYDTWEFIYEEALCSGVPTATPDLSLVATGIENTWDEDTDVYYYSYVFETGYVSGVSDVASDNVYAVKVLADGTVELTGEFESVEVYNVAGVCVLNVKNPAATVATGLGSGLYLVKTVNAEGAVKVLKVAL